MRDIGEITRSPEAIAFTHGGEMSKPIRIFFSPLSRRFYASRAYREEGNGLVTITGEKFDVTNEIANLIEVNQVTFKLASAQLKEDGNKEVER